MSMKWLSLLLLCLVAGCGDAVVIIVPVIEVRLGLIDGYTSAVHDAEVAFAVAQLVDPVAPQTTCDICNGTKRSGDGLGPCPCGKNCECVVPQAARKHRILIFLDVGISTSDDTTENVLPELKKNGEKYGWTVGPENWNMFQTVEHAEHQDLFAKYGVELVPTFLVIGDDEEKERFVGVPDRGDIRDLLDEVEDLDKKDEKNVRRRP